MRAIQIPVAQAKAEFASLISRAEAGEDIIVTRNGRPVARITQLVVIPVVYGDLSDLAIPENLAAFTLPDDILSDFEPPQ